MRKGSTIPRTEDRIETVARYTARGWSASNIAKVMGVTERTVTRIRAKAGVTQPGCARPRWTPERRAFFESLLDDGWSFQEIARTHGADASALSRHFPGRGWTPAQNVEIREAKRRLEALPNRLAAPTEQPMRWNGSRPHLATPRQQRLAAPHAHDYAEVG